MKGKADDVELVAGDILLVPSSNAKKFSQRTVDALIQVATVALSSAVITGAL